MVVFLPWFLLFLLGLSPVVPRERSPEAGPEIGLEVGPETTLSILPGDNVLDLLLPVVPCPVTLSFSPYFPLGPTPIAIITLMVPWTSRPRASLQTSGGSPSNPLFISNSSHPYIYSPMVTFNEPSENVRGMFSFVHSCQFSPGANSKLLLSSLIRR